MNDINKSKFPRPTTISSSTKQTYRKHISALLIAFGSNYNTFKLGAIPELISWFCIQDFRYASSTIRSYSAAIHSLIDYCEINNFFGHELIEQFRHQLLKGPLPKAAGKDKRTSSKKRKSITENDVMRLANNVSKNRNADNLFFARWLWFSTLFFPRPNEWKEAVIHRETFEGEEVSFLQFPNSKATNGRSYDEIRFFQLTMSDNDIRTLSKFITEFKARLESAKSQRHFHDQLRGTLKRACIRNKIKPFPPYSLRGLGIAIAKGSMDSLEVSYAAGHGSDRTKVENYPRMKRKASSWIKPEAAFYVSEGQRSLVKVTGRVRSRAKLDEIVTPYSSTP